MSDDSREYFESVAHKWEEMRRTFFGEGVRDAAIAAADINSSSMVADVGTGTGFIAEGALAAGARVIGIDSSEGMLEEARQRFGVARFEARSGDIESLPVGTGEGRRRSGKHGPTPRDGPAARNSRDGSDSQTGRMVITDADTHQRGFGSSNTTAGSGLNAPTIIRWFQDAGLVDVTVTDTCETCRPTSECGTKAEITIFLARGLKSAGV